MVDENDCELQFCCLLLDVATNAGHDLWVSFVSRHVGVNVRSDSAYVTRSLPSLCK